MEAREDYLVEEVKAHPLLSLREELQVPIFLVVVKPQE